MRGWPVIDDYCRYARQQGLAPTTVYGRGKSLERLARWLGVPLAEATPEMLLSWREMMGRRLCSQSIANYVTDARRFFRWAQESGVRADNPAERLPAPRLGRRLPRPVSTDDLSAAIEAASPRVRRWLVLASLCGMRAKEIALLRRECVFDRAAQPYLLIAADATKGS